MGYFTLVHEVLKKKKKPHAYCKGVGPRSLLSMYILDLRPNSRTKGRPRRSEHCQGNLC